MKTVVLTDSLDETEIEQTTFDISQLKLPEFSVLEKDRAYTFAGEVAYELRNFAPQLISKPNEINSNGNKLHFLPQNGAFQHLTLDVE